MRYLVVFIWGLSSGDGVEFQQCPEALVLLGTRRAADEMGTQAGYERVGGRSGQL
jgi:hypothetical protein